MMDTVAALLSPAGNAELLDSVIREARVGRIVCRLLLVMTAGAALYGAVLGAWRGGPQVLYSAVKLPLVLVVTSLLTLAFNWLTGFLLGLRCRRPAKDIQSALLDRDILVGTSSDPNVVRLLPPLTLEKQHVAKLVSALCDIGQ